MNWFIRILLVLFCSTWFCICQDYSPLELSKEVFTNRHFNIIEKYSIGEYKGRPSAKDFSKILKLEFKLINEQKTSALVNMTVLDSTQTNGTDTYIFLIKDSLWKISAFRALAKTGLLQNMLDKFGKLSDIEIDSIIEVEKSAIHPNITNKTDFNIMLNNIRLTLDLDNNIVQYS